MRPFRSLVASCIVAWGCSSGLAFAQTSSSPAAAPSGSAMLTSATDVAGHVQKVYESTTSFDSDFKQTYTLKAFGQTKTSAGHVTFVKPGKMRWDYTDPSANVVVSDGVTLWSYDAAEKQARKMMVKDSQMPTALSFLTGKGDLTKDFNLELLDAEHSKFPGGYALKATPKVETSLYTFVLFYVDGATFQVRRVLIVDGQDNRNRFDFDKPSVNGVFGADKFQWTPPPGVAVTSNP